jgi:ankyrin repeat protein
MSRFTQVVCTALAAVLLAAATPHAEPAASARYTDSPIADAAMVGDSARIRSLLREGIDVNAAHADGMTALHWAASRGDAASVQMLAFAGARVGAVTRNGNYTPLHLAARAGRAAAVKVLLERGADHAAITSSGGATALHFAAGHGDSLTVVHLVSAGAKVDALDEAYGQTPLMWAAAYDRVAAIRLLLAAGANIEASSKVEDMAERERTDRAALSLRSRRVAALKAVNNPPAPAAARAAAPAARNTSARPGGADSATRAATAAEGRALSYGELIGGKGGLTPLLFAVRDGHDRSVMALLEAGANINHVSGGDNTSPLLMATINGRFDLAKVLLSRGADPKLSSSAGTTPLYATINIQWAAKSLYPQPTAQAQQQTTHLELMKALLDAGADVNARLTKHLWFMSYNFDLLGVNTIGATPFWRAAYGLDVPAMRLLKQYGADHTLPTLKPSGRIRTEDAPSEDAGPRVDPSGLPPVAVGGPGVFPLHAASGVGYGEGFAANSHRHAPDEWIPAVKYLVEELGVDVNMRDMNGYSAVHHAAARGDNALIEYLVSKGADVTLLSRRGQTTADMANGPVQRVPPFLETVALLMKLGSKNSLKCLSC